jgi:hypothetical protein
VISLGKREVLFDQILIIMSKSSFYLTKEDIIYYEQFNSNNNSFMENVKTGFNFIFHGVCFFTTEVAAFVVFF